MVTSASIVTRARRDTLQKRAGEVVGINDKLRDRNRLEVVRMARAVALAGLPKRRSNEPHLSRTLRMGADRWVRITYSASEGNELPFGEDRFVLAGIQHLAIAQQSPVVRFARVGSLLQTFGLSEDGRTIARLRERFRRLSGLSIRILVGTTEADLHEQTAGEQTFIIRKYSLPTRRDLSAERGGQLSVDGVHPYGVELAGDFWHYLQDAKNRLIIPLELLRLFVDRPTGWDYLCFLVSRCSSARTPSEVPHEALLAMFRDSDSEDDRKTIHRLRKYHDEIMLATGGRLDAQLEVVGTFSSTGGRPKQRWALKVAPSEGVFGKALPYQKPSD